MFRPTRSGFTNARAGCRARPGRATATASTPMQTSSTFGCSSTSGALSYRSTRPPSSPRGATRGTCGDDNAASTPHRRSPRRGRRTNRPAPGAGRAAGRSRAPRHRAGRSGARGRPRARGARRGTLLRRRGGGHRCGRRRLLLLRSRLRGASARRRRQTMCDSPMSSPRAKRSRRSAETSTVGGAPVTSSAITVPTMGAC